MGPTNPELEAVKLGEKGTPSTEFCKLQSSHTRKHILDPYARTSGRDPACSWRGVGGGAAMEEILNWWSGREQAANEQGRNVSDGDERGRGSFLGR
jgi:hypothetical protein